ncbi:sphingomyelin phosphodiesterase [Melanogaster broomeanus]|nr:sphingomyelin phosphodiesterase [Melanogaster broomeanus]
MLGLSGSFVLLALANLKRVTATDDIVSAYTAPGEFPTSVYQSYWNDPTATAAQPQPVISDPVTSSIFPANLTDPANFPKLPSRSPKCSYWLPQNKVHFLAEAVCVYFNYSTTCYDEYSRLALGSIATQVVALGDMGGYDGQLLCANELSLCPVPPTMPLDLTGWFAKPKPNPLPPPKQPSGERLKVLHVSDIHIDPRKRGKRDILGYANGYEANCTQYLCCRENAWNTASPDQVLLSAPRYGSFQCDTPISLMLAAMQAIPAVTGTEGTGFNFSLFTDYFRAYVEYAENTSGPLLFMQRLETIDTYMQFQMIPYALGGFVLGNQFNWLYDHVSSMWFYEGWVPEASVEYARTHYAAYSVKRPDGLRIISLDTDMWYTYVFMHHDPQSSFADRPNYRLNYFSYINATQPDPFGILRFLTDELQDAEDAGERVWIVGHVLSGWDGTQSQLNPTNLFYQILSLSVDRYSPHVIANIFFGHTHEDQLSIYYANNATNVSAETAQTVSWIMPSLTTSDEPESPVSACTKSTQAVIQDQSTQTFDILDAYTWISRVDEFPALDNQTEVGPTYVLEYSTREAYGANITWGITDPLNATWWHLVTEQMEIDPSLVQRLPQTFNTYQSKSSAMAVGCTSECLTETICYMRSGSSSIAYQNCNPAYGSTQ